MEILTTLLQLQGKMKDDYFLETNEDSDQPVESNQLDTMIINKAGLFTTSSYREINQYSTFWAIGSGQKLALGAMHALYNKSFSAQEIAEAGILAATEFDDSCALPLNSKTIDLA